MHRAACGLLKSKRSNTDRSRGRHTRRPSASHPPPISRGRRVSCMRRRSRRRHRGRSPTRPTVEVTSPKTDRRGRLLIVAIGGVCAVHAHDETYRRGRADEEVAECLHHELARGAHREQAHGNALAVDAIECSWMTSAAIPPSTRSTRMFMFSATSTRRTPTRSGRGKCAKVDAARGPDDGRGWADDCGGII